MECEISFEPNVNLKKEAGMRLGKARKSWGLTQAEVAFLLRVTQQQYSRFENGAFELSYNQLVFLCELFDVSADWVLGVVFD